MSAPTRSSIPNSRKVLIVAGQADIIYILDKDDDGKAEVIDTIFTGFKGGALERGLNAPQWGPDGWIYFGEGWEFRKNNRPEFKKTGRPATF